MRPGLIFDCDGVIIDTEQAWDVSNRIFLERRGATYVRALHKPMLTGRDAAEGVRLLQSLFGFGGDAAELAEERRAIVRAQLQEVRLMPGFLPFFDWARPQYEVAIATGMEANMFNFIDAKLRLSNMFVGNVITSTDVTRSKPEPDLFLAAAELIGLDPASCVVIADAPLGIEAARRAGMPCVGLATTYPPSVLDGATAVVREWAEAREVISNLTRVSG